MPKIPPTYVTSREIEAVSTAGTGCLRFGTVVSRDGNDITLTDNASGQTLVMGFVAISGIPNNGSIVAYLKNSSGGFIILGRLVSA